MYGTSDTYEKKLIPEEDVFARFLGNFQLNKPISSPFREDNHPSFVVYRNKYTGKLRWLDFGTGESGNYFDLILKLFNCNIPQAIQILKSEVKVSYNASNSVLEEDLKRVKSNKEIKVISRPFNQGMDKVYWSKYYITEDKLKEYDVSAVDELYIDNKLCYIHSNKNPCYAFRIDEGIYKLLSPYGRIKWVSNCKSYHYQGYNQLPWLDELLVITKSLKDVMVLSLFNISAIAPQTESLYIHEDFLNILRKRFNKIVIFYDNDTTGIRSADKICTENGLDSVMIPIEYYNQYKIKDISDFIAKFGIDKTYELIKELKMSE